MKNKKSLVHLLWHMRAEFLLEADRLTHGHLLEPSTVERAREVYLAQRQAIGDISVSVVLDPERPSQQPYRFDVVVLDRYDDEEVMLEELASRYQVSPYVQIDCDGSDVVDAWRFLPQDGGDSGGLARVVGMTCCNGSYYPFLIIQAPEVEW